jgi:CHAD domain-containing protein
MRESVQFNISGDFDPDRFIVELGDQYTIKREPDKTETIRIYDTFDWLLFNKSLVLYESGSKLCLRNLFESTIMQSLEITYTPVFIWEFPESPLKKVLSTIIGARALLNLAEVQSRHRSYSLLNKEGKTVAGLAHEKIRPYRRKYAPTIAAHLCLLPVKGYHGHSEKIARRIEEAGLTTSKGDDTYFKGLESAGKKPGGYSTKIKIQIDPDMRSDHATKVILRFLLQIIRINEANIEKNIDTEFVHDFRVAVRRTRSALGQIKYVFPSKATARFKKDFSFIGQLSNELRDLDVYLLNEDEYKAKLPPALRDDINPLFDHLRKKRSKAFQKVVCGLKSKRYAKILKDWESFLDEPQQDSSTAPNAGLPVIDLAGKRIHKKYRSVVKAGNLIMEDTDDRMMHVLRVHCKKLRYLMEFFSSLFPPEKLNILIDQLKKLQDNLGDFNDLRVQEEYLLSIAGELSLTQGQLKKALVAIGSMVGTLGRERQIVKDAFAKTFTDFASPVNSDLCQELFISQAQQGVS